MTLVITMLALFGFVFGCFVIVIWIICVNHKTYKQRMMLIDFRRHYRGTKHYADPFITRDRLSEEWDAVTYQQHFHALLFFRDPRKLYGPQTQKHWKRKGRAGKIDEWYEKLD